MENTQLKNKFDEFLEKNVIRAIYVVLILLVIGYFRGCSYSNKVSSTKKNSETVIEKLDSLVKVIPNAENLKRLQLLQMEKIGLETTRNMLFNESAIDRRKLTTDQVLNEYNKKIKIIDDQIKKLYEE